MITIRYPFDKLEELIKKYPREEHKVLQPKEHYIRTVVGFREQRYRRYPNWEDARDYDDDLDFYITCCC